MPEGPEATFMQHELNKQFKGCILKNIKITGGRYIRHGIPKELKQWISKQLPLKIIKFHNKGKFLSIEFENHDHIGISLAMTGHIIFTPTTHTHYHFVTDCGTFYLEDMRNFATIHFMKENEYEKKLKSIGPDLLNEKVSNKLFIERIRKYPQKSIATVLLDQKVVSGVGNYLRADSLYKAKINPFRKVKTLTDEELKTLLHHIKKIMKWALKSHIQHKYMRSYQFLVYGRKKTNKHEDVHANKIEKGRSIYWVPSIQI